MIQIYPHCEKDHNKDFEVLQQNLLEPDKIESFPSNITPM